MSEDDEVRDVARVDVARVDVARVDVVAALRQAAPQRSRGRRWVLGAIVGVGGLVVLLGAASLVLGLARSTLPVPVAHPTTPARTLIVPAPSTASDWTTVLAALDDARAAAFARADRSMLDNVYANGSTAARSDADVIASLRRSGVHADGFMLKVLRATSRQHVPIADRVHLDVVDVRPAFRWLNAAGRVVGTQTARGPARWSIELVRGGAAGWLVAAVKPAATSPATTSPAALQRASPQSSGR